MNGSSTLVQMTLIAQVLDQLPKLGWVNLSVVNFPWEDRAIYFPKGGSLAKKKLSKDIALFP